MPRAQLAISAFGMVVPFSKEEYSWASAPRIFTKVVAGWSSAERLERVTSKKIVKFTGFGPPRKKLKGLIAIARKQGSPGTPPPLRRHAQPINFFPQLYPAWLSEVLVDYISRCGCHARRALHLVLGPEYGSCALLACSPTLGIYQDCAVALLQISKLCSDDRRKA
ncbi:hypothetical protein BO99DRAFT_408256 [Aspergillus violaceofuscus CBS 115571]|uniref:Uncharacterized protein n=1 Tax=Aspergillus violaceofuscus (strain CBS 115571) TaxID=1450538 RepID=A0A2V5HK93_ASPV1|nr:hypothetical protein BO99DRAFT_408256 [Aspergillus violaceofuscus CBS 115571]